MESHIMIFKGLCRIREDYDNLQRQIKCLSVNDVYLSRADGGSTSDIPNNLSP